jgi:hypothetical protein
MNTLKDAIQAIKSGDKAKGRTLLLHIVKTNPKHENAWLWLAVAVEDPQQKWDCLQKVLAINPHNQTAKAGLKQLERQVRAKTEEAPQLQDILAPDTNVEDKPQPHKIQPPAIEPEIPFVDPGQAEEIAILFLKLFGYLVVPFTLSGAVIVWTILAYFIWITSDISLGGEPQRLMSLSEAYMSLLSIDGLQTIFYFVFRYITPVILFPSLIIGISHILMIRRLPGGKKAGALQVEQVRTLKLKMSYAQTMHACREAALAQNGRIISMDPESGKIQAKTNLRFFGSVWRETFLFHVTPLEDNLTEVTLTSKPGLRTVLVDWGQNFKHAEAIRNHLKLIEMRQASLTT